MTRLRPSAARAAGDMLLPVGRARCEAVVLAGNYICRVRFSHRMRDVHLSVFFGMNPAHCWVMPAAVVLPRAAARTIVWSGAAAAGPIHVRADAAKSGALIGARKAARCGVTVCYRRHDDGSFDLYVACGPASRGTALQCCSSHWSRDRQRGLCGA